MRRASYPVVQRAAAEYTLHGKTIAEPYIALEDPSSVECKKFVDDQNALFEDFLGDKNEMRKKIFDKISQLQDYPRHSTVGKRLDKFYYHYNSGLQNQSVYMRSNSISGEAPEVFLDPNTLSADGTTALKSASWNKSETLWAYSVSEKGSDWQTIFVRDAQKLTDLTDKIEWVKFSGISWLKDIGFFYTRYPELSEGQEKGAETDSAQDAAIYFHRIGTPQSDDVFIVNEPKHRTWSLGGEVSDCDQFLIVTLHDGCETKNLVWVANLSAGCPVADVPVVFEKIINEFVGEYNYLGNDGETFYFTSTEGAPKKKVVAFNIRTKEATDIIGEKDSVLSFASLVGDTLILVYLEDVKDVVYLTPLKNTAEQLKLPLPIGTVEAISCHRTKSLVSIKITSFLLPGRSYTFDISDPLKTLNVFKDDVSVGFNPDQFETKQVFYTSDDGTRVPMFILHRSGLTLDGSSPLLVYGYGGFNISLTPSFSPSRIVFLNDMNGVIAIPNIRGGGEYGQEWHDGGRRANKQNCFTDFIAAIRYLQSNGYGSPSTTAIMGGSNGGLLVAAVANQAPQLLASVVCQVGVLDMYKFHKFTIGHAWRSDYGDPDVPEDFAVLEKYSPVHNVVAGAKYPAIVVVTGDHDDRVVPLHSHKYVATMQFTNPELGGPFLSRIEVSAGHGAGKPTSKRIQEAADTYTFLAKTLGVDFH